MHKKQHHHASTQIRSLRQPTTTKSSSQHNEIEQVSGNYLNVRSEQRELKRPAKLHTSSDCTTKYQRHQAAILLRRVMAIRIRRFQWFRRRLDLYTVALVRIVIGANELNLLLQVLVRNSNWHCVHHVGDLNFSSRIVHDLWDSAVDFGNGVVDLTKISCGKLGGEWR